MNANAFIDAQLEVTAQRIAEAATHATQPWSRDEESRWLAECVAREATVDAMADVAFWPLVRLGLTPSEVRVLWVLVAQELDPIARMHLRELATEDEIDVGHDVLRRVVYGSRPNAACWEELAPSGALRRLCLVERIEEDASPTHRHTFRVARRVLALAHGSDVPDGELVGRVATPADMPGLDALIIEPAVKARAVEAVAAGARGFTIVAGPDGVGRRSLVVAAARACGRDVVAVDARELGTTQDALTRQLHILLRECLLLDRVPLLLGLDALRAASGESDPLATVDLILGTVFVVATVAHPIARRWANPATSIEVPPLDGSSRATLWKRALPGASDGDAELLSTLYPLSPALISAVGSIARLEARDQPLEPRHISQGMRTVLDDRLAGLATRITVTQDWSDLVLPEDQTMAVVELLARIRTRRRVYEEWGFARKLGKGLGVTALFSGPPGTGKTMCAGLIAKDLGTELYQVDLGKVVSKFIGETEKNLGALFDAAEASHAVLLFDEADSLFGKRTAVQNSNDRHANQETNYLLQRIESFTGICILTTNHDPAIDEAFQRRLSVRVRFPMPDEDERALLWRAMIPTDAPVDVEADLPALAKKYVMAGGNIRNAVLRAAFLAADANEAIGDYHLRQAAQLEYEGMGKLAMKSG